MAGLVPAIHVFAAVENKTWMPATSAGMAREWARQPHRSDQGGSQMAFNRASMARKKN